MSQVESLREALRHSPDNVPLLVLFGEACLTEFLPDQALTAFRKAVEVDPKHVQARIGLAKSLQDVVDRLGATPGGTVEIRARMAVDRAAASVWLLVVDGIGRRISVFDKQRRHVSVHGSYEEAKQRLSRLLDTRQRGHGSITWSIVCRVLGEDTVGEERHGVIKTEAARVPASAS